MPPNNAIAALCSQNRTDEDRRSLFETDLELQNSDHNNTPEGAGAVRGWGGRTGRR